MPVHHPPPAWIGMPVQWKPKGNRTCRWIGSFWSFGKKVPSLKLTASSPVKISGWKMNFLLGWPIFRGELSVSGSVCHKSWTVSQKHYQCKITFLGWLKFRGGEQFPCRFVCWTHCHSAKNGSSKSHSPINDFWCTKKSLNLKLITNQKLASKNFGICVHCQIRHLNSTGCLGSFSYTTWKNGEKKTVSGAERFCFEKAIEKTIAVMGFGKNFHSTSYVGRFN